MTPSDDDISAQDLESARRADQELVFQAIQTALGPAPVERIDTPLSTVFLAGDLAYKAMKAITRRFVDFSALEARRRACEAEISANHAAPALYLRAAPVLAVGDGARIGSSADAAGGGGRVLEWVVVMRRFNRSDEFDRLLGAGRLSVPLIERFADAVAESDRRAAPAPTSDAAASVKRTLDNATATLREQEAGAPDGYRAAVEAWASAAAAAWADIAPRLDARGRLTGDAARVRRCHGDLHLGNVVLLDGAPTPFDAIAFNDDLARIDIAYDAAFAAMDLRAREGAGPAPLAAAFLSRWLSATRDYSGLAAWPLFVSLRAAIRGMVAAFGGDFETALARLSLASDALAPRPAFLLGVGGASGAGKTTLARALAPRLQGVAGLGAVHLRSDVARKRLLGLPPEDRAPPEAYRPEVSALTMQAMLRDAGDALDAGASVLWDMTFLSRSDRDAVAALAAGKAVPFRGLWLELDVEARAARAAARAEAIEPDASDAGPDIARAQVGDPLDEPGWSRLDAAADHATLVDNAAKSVRSFLF